MAKPDPALLDPARYAFVCEVATRFADLDTNLHLNNVALAGLIEEGRTRFHTASNYRAGIEGWAPMVANLTIDYLGQGFYPAPLSLHVGVTTIGRTSYGIAQLVRQGDAVVALARSVMVCVKDDAPFPVPDAFRESVQPWMFRA